MIRITVSLIISILFLSEITTAQESETTRNHWLHQLEKVAWPVMSNIAADELKIHMPVVLSETCDNPDQRKKAAHLEAFARTISGIAPWLNDDGGSVKEIALRRQPGLADFYITTGSLYLCTTIFLPLGLPADDPFWT